MNAEIFLKVTLVDRLLSIIFLFLYYQAQHQYQCLCATDSETCVFWKMIQDTPVRILSTI